MIALIAIALVIPAGDAPAPAPAVVVKARQMGYKACKHEDSPGPCYWNATKRGNGNGRSFVVLKNGKVVY